MKVYGATCDPHERESTLVIFRTKAAAEKQVATLILDEVSNYLNFSFDELVPIRKAYKEKKWSEVICIYGKYFVGRTRAWIYVLEYEVQEGDGT